MYVDILYGNSNTWFMIILRVLRALRIVRFFKLISFFFNVNQETLLDIEENL